MSKKLALLAITATRCQPDQTVDYDIEAFLQLRLYAVYHGYTRAAVMGEGLYTTWFAGCINASH